MVSHSEKATTQKIAAFSQSDSDDLLKTQIGQFLGEAAEEEALLLMPRSEVLQRKMMFSRTESGLTNLESGLEKYLPYAPKDMAYSIALDGTDTAAPQTSALLYAMPDQKIKEIMARLQKLGLKVGEVVSEDQALFWLFQNKAADGNTLVIDIAPERALFLALNKNTICLSNTYPSQEDMKSALQEMSFSLLEAGIKITSAIACGQVDKDEIARLLGVPVQSFESERIGEMPVPAVIAGVRERGGRAAISLLPSSQKIQNRLKIESRRTKQAALMLGLFIFSCLIFHATHWMLLSHKKNLIMQESQKLSSSVLEVRKMRSDLDAIKNAQRSKVRLLIFLKSLADRVPAAVRMKEMQIDDPSIVVQGESPSHAVLTQAVQEMEKMDGLQEVKLEHARLRKKLNQDYFEFEITARWKS